MSTIVFQGLHSYFESQLIETTTLKLKVANCMVAYEPKEKCHIQETNYKPPNPEFSGWNSIQNLSNISFNEKETTQKHNSYIHPLTKKSPKLSQKSLELCTENLGSETGSDDSIDISILSLNSSNNYMTNVKSPFSEDHQELPKQMKTRSNNKAQSFPPPLTTMRSPNSIQLRPYREDGRLRIEAFEVPSRNTYLLAERSNGRLILSFINDSPSNNDSETTNEDNAAIETNEHELNNECNNEEEVENYEENERNMNEMDQENIQKLGRCNESQHGDKSSSFWTKPMWVATF
ncbi:hypothetical protein Leryth_003755 [Lithospermum erythrorhizon]|nr:hypothetical protein Leryth_003755 [Lithospermum erythrorhizon]